MTEIRDCDFVNNDNSSAYGMIKEGTKVLYNCRFYGSKPNCVIGIGVTLYNCVISNCQNVVNSTLQPFFSSSTLYNCILSNNRVTKPTAQLAYGPHLVDCKLYNCTIVLTSSARPNPSKLITAKNEIMGCVLVNTVVDVVDDYVTSLKPLGDCSNLYATNSCLPVVFMLSDALKGASNNIYYGPESQCKKTGLITEGDKQHQLAKGSVCIDSGWDGKSENNPAGFAYLKSSDANEFYGIDYFGSKRISGKAVDIGASERAIPGFTIRVR